MALRQLLQLEGEIRSDMVNIERRSPKDCDRGLRLGHVVYANLSHTCIISTVLNQELRVR